MIFNVRSNQIDSIALYDAGDIERGSCGKLADDDWSCDYHGELSQTHGVRDSLEKAVAFLEHYGAAELASGGSIESQATFKLKEYK